MKEPLGDTIFWILIIILGSTLILGWVVLLTVTFLQWIIPKSNDKLEKFLQTASKPLGIVQKYSIYSAVILFILRLVVGWLGWAPPLNSSGEE